MAPIRLHFVGVGGIGMSALAAMALDRGYQVSGSDRGAEKPENARIIGALRASGLELYSQDGSFMAGCGADAVVYSTAIEEDNPDFAAAKDIPRMHRSELLARLLGELPEHVRTIAVTGSCGKSTVTAYVAEALRSLGADPGCLNGALVKRFMRSDRAGNYRSGNGDFFVFEADESDKSLLNYPADYAVILNLGTDHYDRDELVRVFGEFLRSVRRGAVLEHEVYEALKEAGMLPENLPLRVFGKAVFGVTDALADYRMETRLDAAYRGGRKLKVVPGSDRPEEDRIGANNLFKLYGLRPEEMRLERKIAVAEFGDGTLIELPQPGAHMALNALAVGALLKLLGIPERRIPRALETFEGVWRRNDFAGYTANGAAVYDDYAHNPEKIRANLGLVRELVPGGVYAVFQPHGYGPFGFMKDKLFEYLEDLLRGNDRFILLEPYYAGGTSSFSPHSEEVCAEWKKRSAHPERYMFFPDREGLRDYLLLKCAPGDAIAVMGARDNTLAEYAASLCAGSGR